VQNPRCFESKIFKTLWELKKDGYAEDTIETTDERLKHLAKYTDLNDPESVKGFIANKDCTKAHKSGLCDCYARYVRYNDLQWSKPRYRRENPVITLPTEERVDLIIGSCKLKHKVGLSLIKECGLRPVELHNLSLRYIDLENSIISIKTSKGGRSRQERIKPRTLALLKTYISKNGYGFNDQLFSKTKTTSRAFQNARNRLAKKYNDPEFLKIRLYDLRHFYGSMLYHETKDLFYVKEKMGHRSISSTMKYMHLIKFESENFIVKVAQNLDEFTDLLGKGFNYVSDFNGMKVLRKRK